jgi:hypothetical protein
MAYYQLEPFGVERDDLRSGIIAATIANSNRDPKKQKKPFTPEDFMLKPAKESPGANELSAKLDAVFGSWGQ